MAHIFKKVEKKVKMIMTDTENMWGKSECP